MSVEIAGMAHVQLTVNDLQKAMPFYEKALGFLGGLFDDPEAIRLEVNFVTDKGLFEDLGLLRPILGLFSAGLTPVIVWCVVGSAGVAWVLRARWRL